MRAITRNLCRAASTAALALLADIATIATPAIGSLMAGLLMFGPLAIALSSLPAPAAAAEVTTLLQATRTGDDQPLAYPAGAAKVTAITVTLEPGASTGRHRHPMPVVGYILDGTLTVFSDGAAPRQFTTGQSFVETTTWHEGRNTGTTPVRILAIYLGADGQPLVIKPDGNEGHY